jgi:alkylation response protein AidB-like acyl-CoA dehydrogenase
MIDDPDFQRKLAELEIRIEALNMTELRVFSRAAAGQAIGPASSMLKCQGSEAQQAITELTLEAVGAAVPFRTYMEWVLHDPLHGA